ncbi:methyltransferase domain-containing protein [Thermofilum sp.]|uniref:methyltransferase domain-containing protein n=1 Tax=Thermofilum sp. TaxID=1961369 RepID=UPI0031649681
MTSEHLSRYVFASKLIYGVVLDVASGTCYGSSILKRCSASKLIASVDLDADLLRYGRMIYGVDCVCADATHLPFRDKCFDSVVSLETLEHIEDQKAFLGNIKRVLKDEGMFILSTPNKMYSSPLLPRPLNPYHIKEYYLGTFLKLLNSQGFKVNSIYGGKEVGTNEVNSGLYTKVLV